MLLRTLTGLPGSEVSGCRAVSGFPKKEPAVTFDVVFSLERQQRRSLESRRVGRSSRMPRRSGPPQATRRGGLEGRVLGGAMLGQLAARTPQERRIEHFMKPRDQIMLHLLPRALKIEPRNFDRCCKRDKLGSSVPSGKGDRDSA